MFFGLIRLFSVGIALFFMLPLAIVISVSFTSGYFISFPPDGFSLKWYKEVLLDYEWMNSLRNSLQIAVGTALLSTSMGGVLAFVLYRYNISSKLAGAVKGLGLLPILLPPVTFGVALMTFFYLTGLAGQLISVIIAHSIFFLPFPLILISAGLAEIDKSVEEAALTLGATKGKTFRTVTLPLIRSNLFAAMLFSFVLSLNEFIVAFLIAGLTITTMPIKIFTSLRYALSPEIAAISTLFIIVTIASVLIINRLTGGLWKAI